MELRILGPVCVMVDGIDVVLDGAKPRTVLAALLLARGRVLTDTQLAALLWEWSPPATASAQIYTYVSRLRRRLGPDVDIVRRSPGYLFRMGEARFDCDEFELRSRLGHGEAATGQDEAAAHHFRMALAEWRGPALANVTEYLANTAAPPLDEARMATLEALIGAELRLGDHLRLASELTGLVTEYPLREGLRVQLMTALYRCDRQADAMLVYHDGRRLLAEELGVDPSPALVRTYGSVLSGALALDRLANAPPRATSLWTRLRPAMLPPDVAEFAGRENELAEVHDEVRRPREPAVRRAVVAITGMPGVGKTALAVRAAHACREHFPDGQLYADLGGRTPGAKGSFDVLGSFLTALGVQLWAIPAGLDERLQLYRSRLADRRMLVLLDNAASDDQVRPLLPSGVGCRTIVTSRKHLATLDGAHVLRLAALDPDSAIRLLGCILSPDRVAAEPAAARQVVEFCGRLPLALRVAAAQLASRPQRSLARLAERLSDERSRLDELQAGDGSGARDAIRPSYEELDDATRQAFRRLTLLGPDEFTVSAAAAVLDAPEVTIERLLETLVDARLLDVADDQLSLPHYRLNELVRCFAGERFRHEDAVRV